MSKKININNWKEIRVGELFNVFRGKSMRMQTLFSGKTPIIAAAGYNQGVAGYYDIEAKYNNAITISLNGAGCGSTFYHDYSFYITGDAAVLIEKSEMSNEVKKYITSIYNKFFREKYSYSDKCTPQKIEKDTIKLPVDNNGIPDWNYMEQYIKKVEEQTRKSIKRLNNCSEETNKMDITEWGEFHLYDIFDIDSGSKMDKIAMRFNNPTINFVGRSGVSNGVTAVVDEVKDYVPYKAGNLTLALGGAYLGSCFVQEKDFYTSQNVIVLLPKEDISFYAKQFICAVIFKEGNTHYKAFIDELNRHIKTDFAIKLPVDSNGKPNYEYMDKYMEKLLNKTKNKLICLNNI